MYRILNPKLLKDLLLDHQNFMFSSKFGTDFNGTCKSYSWKMLLAPVCFF
jgi:hypothetical protein